MRCRRSSQEHPDWLILDKDGKHARMTRELAVLDPSLPEVQALLQAADGEIYSRLGI